MCRAIPVWRDRILSDWFQKLFKLVRRTRILYQVWFFRISLLNRLPVAVGIVYLQQITFMWTRTWSQPYSFVRRWGDSVSTILQQRITEILHFRPISMITTFTLPYTAGLKSIITTRIKCCSSRLRVLHSYNKQANILVAHLQKFTPYTRSIPKYFFFLCGSVALWTLAAMSVFNPIHGR
jgi:hypothetical protein